MHRALYYFLCALCVLCGFFTIGARAEPIDIRKTPVFFRAQALPRATQMSAAAIARRKGFCSVPIELLVYR